MRAAKAALPSGSLRKAEPISQLRKLLSAAEARKATVLPRRMNHVPPRMPLRAV